jgi:glycerol-3-phosphate O-acyltransferase/dihydroxyacetone phosphate acyltransferase
VSGRRVGPLLLRALARALVRLFYHRVEVVGLERVPRQGPLVVVANHRNALVDPLLLIATMPRTLRPVAKAPLFRHPLVAPFLTLAGALPVHRRHDPGSDLSRNVALFAAAATALRGGDAILIFPEGLSQPEPMLMPLRTGVARLVLGTEGEAGVPTTTLLPVGLVFHEPGTFRSGWALVLVGSPLPLADCYALAATEPESAVRELTRRLSEALRTLIVDAENRETLRLTEGLEAIRRTQADDDAAVDAPTAPSRMARVAWIQVAARAHRWLAPREPIRVRRLRAEVERYLADLERLGLPPRAVGRVYPAGVVARYAAREGLALLGGLPVALWGVATHALPYALTALAARCLASTADVAATVKLMAGAILYPACWALEAWLVWRLLGGWGLVAFLALLIPTGLVALGWQARLERVRRDARAFLRFLWDRDLFARLAARRRALLEETESLARLLPAKLRPGPGSEDRVR